MFRDLEALAISQVERGEAYDVLDATLKEKEAEIASLQTDLAEIRADHEALVNEKLLLQDRLESAIADKDRLWNQMQSALDNERYAVRSQVNVFSQKSGGGIPYPDAHSLPPESIRPPQPGGMIGRSRMLPSEREARQRSAAITQIVNDLTARHEVKPV